MHQNNLHANGYDFEQLKSDYPPLESFIIETVKGTESINFFDPQSVLALNKALLISSYKLEYWDIPAEFLCPAVPGRADYILNLNDLFEKQTKKKKIQHEKIKILDIGTGANCVYPLLGHQIFGWQSVGTDVNPQALANAELIVEKNPTLKDKIELRLQKHKSSIFAEIIKEDEIFDAVVCNPPFFSSEEEAKGQNVRKNNNLSNTKNETHYNFGGAADELWCEGGEKAFIQKMVQESRQYSHKIVWFTILVSKERHATYGLKLLKSVPTAQKFVIPMGQGNKKSRLLTWTFFDVKAMKNWVEWKTK